jgi:hypothetical protein
MGKSARLMIWLMVLVLAVPLRLPAQVSEGVANREENYTYTQERLDQLLAPIALYPDVLLSQIFMASTYPLEVVEADRWLKKNPGLTGDRLDEALKGMSWDLSVKSLCHFPKVLDMMSMKLEYTIDLGNAYLNQEDQVMDTLQKLRAKAMAAGSLASTDKEKIIVEDQYISIEPVEPEVVYLPTYDPCLVYGPWWYPECTPFWFWWPGVVVGGGFFFGPPIFFGRLHGWCGFNWRLHHIFVHPARVAFLGGIGITRLHGGVETWHHNPIHRRGVAYPGPGTAARFGQVPRPGVEARRPFRGFSPPASSPESRLIPGRPTPAPGPIERGRRPEGLSRPPEIQRPVRPEIRGPGPMIQPQFRQPGRGSSFEGFGRSGSEVRQHSERGFQSLGSGIREGGRPGGGSRGGGQPDRGFEGGTPQGRTPPGGDFGGRGHPSGGRR